MNLAAGSSIGPHRIVSQLGAGGMGEVYRARDTRLGREVALKVLPSAFSSDPERMARFSREAQLLAALNHPNIAAIYGIEESGGVRALVMELVEGVTLADLIRRGPIPRDRALSIARQIAEAIEFAHDKGIVHRDLKPANVKITPDGVVKVLDFGLAKGADEDSAPGDPHSSPTITIAASALGMILGTAPYMSPEQAHGRAADRRSDIWSFGVVLYEMLTAKQAFPGESVSGTLAAVLMAEPDWHALPKDTPPAIRRLLLRCLTKDARKRLQAAGEARIVIEEALANPTAPEPITETRPSRWPLLTTAVLALALIVAAIGWWRATRPVSHPVLRLHVDLGPEAVLSPQRGSGLAVSPDGTRLAFISRDLEGRTHLAVRALDSPRTTALAGSDGGVDPFFSPDGQWVAFFADESLKKAPVQGGAAVTLCDAPTARGGSWADDNTIVFASTYRGGLSRISASGGSPQPVTQLDEKKGEVTHRYPQALPSAVLFTSSRDGADYQDASIEAVPLKGGRHKTLVQGAYFTRYLASGHIVYLRRGSLFAAPINARTLEITGPASPVLEDVKNAPAAGVAHFDISRDGMAVYVPEKGGQNQSVFWLDGQGNLQKLGAAPRLYSTPRVSPDGTRLALAVRENANTNLWVYEWATERLSPLTFIHGVAQDPVWTPDGRHIAFSAREAQSPVTRIEWIRADGGGQPQKLFEGHESIVPRSFSPDGRQLAFDTGGAETKKDIWILPIDLADPERPKPGKAAPFLVTDYDELQPSFSPDGRWVAYFSNESGRSEVYVRAFPGPGGKWQVSTNGGLAPVWSRNGRDLFYSALDGRNIMAVTWSMRGADFNPGQPRVWSERMGPEMGPVGEFDVMPDGKRVALLRAEQEGGPGPPPTQAVFVLNFFDEIRRVVAAAGQ